MPKNEPRSDIPDLDKLRQRAHLDEDIDRRYLERGKVPCISPGADEEPALDVTIKTAAALDLKQCRWSREQVAEGLSAILERSITVAQIDAVTSKTHSHQFHLAWLPAWVRITGSRRLLDLVCAASGLWAVDGGEWDLAQYARASLTAEKLKKRIEGNV